MIIVRITEINDHVYRTDFFQIYLVIFPPSFRPADQETFTNENYKSLYTKIKKKYSLVKLYLSNAFISCIQMQIALGHCYRSRKYTETLLFLTSTDI
jgi:hypothetical protein